MTAPHPLHGVLVRVGAFEVGGEVLDGVVINCRREDLAALPRLPLYETVAVVPPMSVLIDRLPTIEEAQAAIAAPLHESYWWFDGLNFNRPVVAEVVISAHITEGPKVRVFFPDETPISGFGAEHFAGRSFRMCGPIPFPAELTKKEGPND